MSTMLPINSANFEEKVLKSPIPCLVEFGAVWCGPCKRLEPELEKLQDIMGDKFSLGKLDVDESSDLAVQYGVMSVPTLILFVDGQARQRVSGFQPIQRLIDLFRAHLAVEV